MVICAPDDEWRNHPKYVEQFTDKIDCIWVHLVGYLLTYNCDARSHEHKIQLIKLLTVQFSRVPYYHAPLRLRYLKVQFVLTN